MEWGTFITVIIAIYLGWFGLNFLYDLIFSKKPQLESTAGILYNMGDLMAQEEKPQIVNEKDFEQKPIEVHQTEEPAPTAPVPSDFPEDGSSGQNIGTPAAPAPVEALPQMQAETDDWASSIDQEDKIDIPVQGKPVPVSDFIQSLKDQAKAETSAITF